MKRDPAEWTHREVNPLLHMTPETQLQVNSERGREGEGTGAGQRPAGEEGLRNRSGCGLYLQQRIKIGKGNGDKRNCLDLR